MKKNEIKTNEVDGFASIIAQLPKNQIMKIAISAKTYPDWMWNRLNLANSNASFVRSGITFEKEFDDRLKKYAGKIVKKQFFTLKEKDTLKAFSFLDNFDGEIIRELLLTRYAKRLYPTAQNPIEELAKNNVFVRNWVRSKRTFKTQEAELSVGM